MLKDYDAYSLLKVTERKYTINVKIIYIYQVLINVIKLILLYEIGFDVCICM